MCVVAPSPSCHKLVTASHSHPGLSTALPGRSTDPTLQEKKLRPEQTTRVSQHLPKPIRLCSCGLPAWLRCPKSGTRAQTPVWEVPWTEHRASLVGTGTWHWDTRTKAASPPGTGCTSPAGCPGPELSGAQQVSAEGGFLQVSVSNSSHHHPFPRRFQKEVHR